jgi:hypothetical protein
VRRPGTRIVKKRLLTGDSHMHDVRTKELYSSPKPK